MEKQNQMPTVSVIITVYNMEKYLRQCMESILKQSYQNLDIVMVDDGSRDTSPALCDLYASRDTRVRVLHKANGGLVSAWMAGVEMAIGKYVVFVDSDDWIDSEMIEQLVSQSAGDCKEIICCNYVIEKEKDKPHVMQTIFPGIYDRERLEKELFPELLGNERRIIHCSRCMKLFSKELIVDNMQYSNLNVTMGEDLVITFPAILDAERIAIMEDGYYYHYRFVGDSMAHQYDADLYKKIELLYQTMDNLISRKIDFSQQDFWRKKWKEEYLFLLLLAIKNELRGSMKGVISRIRYMVFDAKRKASYTEVPMSECGIKNKLLYKILQYPNRINITLGKVLLDIFDTLNLIRNT